jgi:hypothetical protein
VTSFDSGRGADPIDPDFAALFRPEDISPAVPDDDEPHFEPIMDPVVDPRDEDAALAAAEHDEPPAVLAPEHSEAAPEIPPVIGAEPTADTGRLFRSQGVSGHSEAVLALSADRFGRLRTLDRRSDAEPVAVLADAGPIDPTQLDAHGISSAAAAAPAVATARRGRRLRRSPVDSPSTDKASGGHRAREITGGAVYLIVFGVTLLVGFANALLADGDIGWPTGLALLVSGVYAALTVRREDDITAIISPPVAFLVVALTAGQLFLGPSAGSLLNRAVVTFFTLADNWVWILGTTLATLVIVLVRRRRA